MKATNRGRSITTVGPGDLRQMIGPDEHRPGSARARLLAEQIPVWAVVGHIGALAETTDPAAMTDEVIA